MAESMLELMTKLKREIAHGGELDNPCPLCGLPRSQRSDYIRCSPCGVNWLEGENLEKDPRIERFQEVRFPRSGVPSHRASTGSPTASNAAERTEGAKRRYKCLKGC